MDQGPWQGPCFIFITSSKAVSPNSSRVAVLRVRASPKELGAQLSPNLCILCWCRCIGSHGPPHGLAPPDLLLLSFTSSIACSNVLCSMSSLWEVLNPPFLCGFLNCLKSFFQLLLSLFQSYVVRYKKLLIVASFWWLITLIIL